MRQSLNPLDAECLRILESLAAHPPNPTASPTPPVAPTQEAQHDASHRDVLDLLEVVEELLALPELYCFDPDEPFSKKEQTIARARSVRAAVRDELASMEWLPKERRASPSLGSGYDLIL